jgi:hypothetical protein
MPAGPPPAIQQVVGVDCEVEFSAVSEHRQEFATDLNVPGCDERWLLEGVNRVYNAGNLF